TALTQRAESLPPGDQTFINELRSNSAFASIVLRSIDAEATQQQRSEARTAVFELCHASPELRAQLIQEFTAAYRAGADERTVSLTAALLQNNRDLLNATHAQAMDAIATGAMGRNAAAQDLLLVTAVADHAAYVALQQRAAQLEAQLPHARH